MELRRIGKSDLHVAPLCLGGNVFGWTIDEQTSFEVLDAFVAHGGNFIDTADVYSTWAPGNVGGESEVILGKWMQARGNRAKIIVATKVGSKMPAGEGLSERWITRAVEESLRRLQTDVIDLYQSHIDDKNTPLDETLRAFDKLVKQGKVRALGASNYDGKRLDDAVAHSQSHKLARYECLQPKYNLASREYEHDQEPMCEAHGIGVIPYSSLASGFLTGKYQPGQTLPKTQRAGGVEQRYFNEQGFGTLARVETTAKALNATPAQVALAWLIARPSITAPIASATSVEQVQELMGALEVRLPEGALA